MKTEISFNTEVTTNLLVAIRYAQTQGIEIPDYLCEDINCGDTEYKAEDLQLVIEALELYRLQYLLVVTFGAEHDYFIEQKAITPKEIETLITRIKLTIGRDN